MLIVVLNVMILITLFSSVYMRNWYIYTAICLKMDERTLQDIKRSPSVGVCGLKLKTYFLKIVIESVL